MLYLIPCSGPKRAQPCAGKDMYRSRLFKGSRAYVEARNAQWLILSGQYGVVHPDEVIAPYDFDLSFADTSTRKKWAKKVIKQLKPYLPTDKIVIFAGVKYRQYLMTHLEANAKKVTAPLQHMKIGYRLQWLTRDQRRSETFWSEQ